MNIKNRQKTVSIYAVFNILVLSALSGAGTAVAQLPDAPAGSQPTVTVSGDGSAFIPPDRVRITAEIDGGAVGLASFNSEIEKREKRLLELIRPLAADIKILSRGDRLHGPVPESAPALNSVAAADRAVTIETTHLEAAGAIADAVLKSGAKIYRIEYLASEASAPYEQAIEAATARAKAKAGAAARGLGLRLGRALEVAVSEEPAGDAIQRDRELGRDPDRFSSREVRIFVTARYEVMQ
jgi:uncharacterized protein YggE